MPGVTYELAQAFSKKKDSPEEEEEVAMDFEVYYEDILQETDTDYLLLYEGVEVVIPKHLIRYEDMEEQMLVIPEWLAEEKELV